MVSDADQSGDHSADAAKNKDTAAAATQRALETMPGQTRTGLTIAFGVLGLIFFFTHRMWPKGCKRIDLIFAGDHYVEDTHAKRMLDTRLGASFTLMLPCIIGVAVVQIFGAENSLHTKGLEPAVSLDPPLPKVTTATEVAFFKHIDFEIAAFAPTSAVACGDIVARTSTSTTALTCTRSDEDEDAAGRGADATFCRITLRCAVSSELRGTSDLHLSFPDAFQNIHWTVTPEAWDGEHIVTKISESLAAREDDHILSGTVDKPTTLSFGTIRTRFRNLLGAQDKNKTKYEHGLQLSYLGESVQESAPESTASSDGKHHVSFRLEVEESVFVSEWSDKLDVASRLSTAFAMLLTAMSIMRVAKTFLERGIDSLLIWRAEMTASEMPADVARRIIILKEKFIADSAVGPTSGRGTSSTAARRLSEIGQSLSLVRMGSSTLPATNAASEVNGVEMTSFAVNIKNPMKERNFRSGGSSAAVKSGNDGVAVVTNPLSAEPPTRREFEMQQQRIEEQQRCIEEQRRCNEEQREEQRRCNEEQQRRIEEQQRRIEEQQRQIDNLMKMVTAFKGGSPAIGTDALLESTESADATNASTTNASIAGGDRNTTNDSSDSITGGTDLGEEWSLDFDESGKAYYYNKLTGVVQWENPMTGNEDSVANKQSSLHATTTKPIANRRNSRRRSSFAKNRRRSSVKTALKASIAENQPGKYPTR